MRFRLNDPQVIAETVGEETIVVNLNTGHYFSLRGTAVDIWYGLTQRESVDAVAGMLREHYEAPAGEIERAVSQFADELALAELIVGVDGDREASTAEPEAAPATNGSLKSWTAPTFAAFTDMQDIILLDPVHEVDATGWPHSQA